MNNVYTHGHHESVLRSHRWRTAENSAGYLLPHLRSGMSLLDVGAGPGTITADLARLVEPGRTTRSKPASGARDHPRDLRRTRRRTWSSSSATCTSWTCRTTRTTWCTHTRSCSTWPIRSRRCVRCAGSANRAESSPPATRTTRVRLVSVAARAGRVDGRSTSDWPGPTVASRTPVAGCCPGRGRPGFENVDATSTNWTFATPRTARGGAGCGPTGSCSPRWPTRRGRPAYRSQPCRASRPLGTVVHHPDAWHLPPPRRNHRHCLSASVGPNSKWAREFGRRVLSVGVSRVGT